MKMTKRLAMVCGMAALLAAPALASDSTFLKEIDDLPLAPGLVEQPGGTLFDAPQGRIVEATASGQLLEVEVRQFYDESLPGLGWTEVASGVYRRDKEVLSIEYSEGMPMTVHFSLTPVATDKDKKKDKDKDKDKAQTQDQVATPDEGAK